MDTLITLQVSLPASDLSGLHRAHLLRPPLGGLKLLHSADLVRSIAWHADVVVAFKDKLDIAYLQGG